MKALIAYGTRYGATTGPSEEIGKILREEGFDTKIVNLKEEKIKARAVSVLGRRTTL